MGTAHAADRWIAVGAAWAIWGNYLPELLSPWPTEGEPFAWQRVHRFVGSVFSMVGVGIIGVADAARLNAPTAPARG